MRKNLDVLGKVQPSSKQCRVLLLIGGMRAGGEEQQVCYLLEELDRQRYWPVLVVWNYAESDVNLPKVRSFGIPIWGYPIAKPSLWKLYTFSRLVRKLAPEVVHSYSFYTNFAAFCAARASGAIAVGSLQSELDFALKQCGSIRGRLNASLPRDHMCNSQAAARQIMRNRKWCSPRRLTVVPNGLDPRRFRKDPLPIDSPFRILGIGSLQPIKRWDRLLMVAQKMKSVGLPCIVQIAGEGPLRGELKALAAKLGVGDITHFLGYRDDIPDLIARARVIVHTSDSEGCPNAVMEALASGRPVVATDVGDVGKLIEHGKTGFVVPRTDLAEFVHSVIKIVTDDRLAIDMGRSAAEYAEREFSLSRLVQETIEMYCAAGWKR